MRLLTCHAVLICWVHCTLMDACKHVITTRKENKSHAATLGSCSPASESLLWSGQRSVELSTNLREVFIVPGEETY